MTNNNNILNHKVKLQTLLTDPLPDLFSRVRGSRRRGHTGLWYIEGRGMKQLLMVCQVMSWYDHGSLWLIREIIIK